MSSATYLAGDAFDRMAEMPDGSVDLVLTSPPFLALRSYLPPDHPDKHKEIGAEATPAAFIDTLLRLAAEWRRLLAPHGSICVELGDCYAGSGGAGGDYLAGGWRDGQPPFAGTMKHARVHDPAVGPPIQDRNGKHQGGGDGWPLDKSLCLVPELCRVALAYGMNPLTGELSPAGRWRVRNVVRWCRPNPAPGALGDKFRPATTDVLIACTAQNRWFDLDAVRTPHTSPGAVTFKSKDHSAANPRSGWASDEPGFIQNPIGAPPLDWWLIATQPYKGAHYATWPEALCVRPILAMCPRRVCTTCGQPSECEHDTWRRGLVLDPFAGTGTTLAVATGHGRDAIGIDLDPRSADLAAARVGMFLEVVA